MQSEDGSLVHRDKGTSQGGMISPLLADLFLHYAFDTWMQRQYPQIPFDLKSTSDSNPERNDLDVFNLEVIEK